MLLPFLLPTEREGSRGVGGCVGNGCLARAVGDTCCFIRRQ
jgi:hypothetical protein